jgi:hypothetical protein
MLQMKKNTGAKIAALAASLAAAGSIFGLVRQNAPASAASTPALVQASTTGAAASSSTTATSSTSTSGASTSTRSARVMTRTRAS